MRRKFLRAIRADRRRRVQEAGTSIESLMELGKVREVWVRILLWYQQARGVYAPPTTEAMYQVSMDREELYRCRPPEGLQVLLLLGKYDIKDGTPT